MSDPRKNVSTTNNYNKQYQTNNTLKCSVKKSFLLRNYISGTFYEKLIFLLQERVKQAAEKLDAMNDAFFARLVPSENLVLKSPGLTSSLKKVSADGIKGLSMEDGPTKFKLPGNLGNMADGNINAKVKSFRVSTYSKPCISRIRCHL